MEIFEVVNHFQDRSLNVLCNDILECNAKPYPLFYKAVIQIVTP